MFENYLEDDFDADVFKIKHYLTSRGCLQLAGSQPSPISITLAPTPVSHAKINRLRELQPVLNRVLDKMSLDYDVVVSNLEGPAQSDELLRNLLEIYKETRGGTNPITVGLHRHDFMLHQDNRNTSKAKYKLVEFNLAAVSLSPFTDGAYKYHQTVVNKLNLTSKENLKPATGQLAMGLKTGYDAYIQRYPSSKRPVVAMVYDDKSLYNYFDQQCLMNAIEDFGIPTIRITIEEVTNKTKIDCNNKFIYNNDVEVAILYLRVFYNPSHYPSPEVWEARRRMEVSDAISVPNVRHQIVNTKIFQMVLAQHKILSKYADKDDVDSLLDVFGEILPLTLDKEGDENARQALLHPGRFVMKPQRDGGGHNLWDREMVETLEKLKNNPERSRFILMRILKPPVLKNRFLRSGETVTDVVDTKSEIGLYSTYCIVDGTEVRNENAGILVRTKLSTTNEGGVAAGFSVIDSPFFV